MAKIQRAVMNSFVLVGLMAFTSYAQNTQVHTIKITVSGNAFMCPNLSMKIKRTLIIRKGDMSNWKIGSEYNSATFTTTNSAICNQDSLLKIFVRESEYPLHIFREIQVDENSIYKKAPPVQN